VQGQLGPGTLIALFRVLHAAQKSGILEISSGEANRKLLFQTGAIKFASTNVGSERLGEHLVQVGKLRQADLDKATRQVGRGERLGQILVRLGMISQEELQKQAREHILKIIYACFAIEAGVYRYDEMDVALGQEIKAGLPMGALIMEGVRRMNPNAAAAALGSGDQILRPTTNPRLRSQPVTLLPQEGFLLSRVDGSTRVDDIVVVSPLPAQETLRTLLGLWCAGLIEDPRDPARLPFDLVVSQHDQAGAAQPPSAPPTPAAAAAPAPPAAHPAPAARPAAGARRAPATRSAPPRPAAVRREAVTAPVAAEKAQDRAREVGDRFQAAPEQTLYGLLGIQQTADETEIRHAYYALARRLHPDRFQAQELEEVRPMAERLFAMLTEAYNILSDSEMRQAYDRDSGAPDPATAKADQKKEATSLARQNFMHGRALIEQGQFHSAITFFENAIQQDPRKAEYYQFLASVQMRNPKWRQQAVENFRKALEIDPSLVACYVSLGQLHRRLGEEAQAEKMFREALRWEPDHPVAQQELAGGAGAGAAAGKGAGIGSVFKGMFKK
jgi:curved DNA-binding protein CbpA